MTTRMWLAWATLGALFALDLAVTAESRASWHAAPGGPQVMTLGQLLGFITSAGLLVVLVLVSIAGCKNVRRDRAYRRLQRGD
ncbi:MAG TPA: hypothetical protein VMB79_05490 [Jatrophihabitans sp.]|nr:hypothetical protein [Jatrophihabitans sp.]